MIVPGLNALVLSKKKARSNLFTKWNKKIQNILLDEEIF